LFLHPYTALVWGMGASVMLFFAAWFFRTRNNPLHRRLAILGVVFNLVSSIYLVYAVRIAGFDMPARFGDTVVTAHRLFATLMAVMMLVMLWSGIRRRRGLHVALHRIFLPGYTLTYISGLAIFHV
jgi:hypothetical protein